MSTNDVGVYDVSDVLYTRRIALCEADVARRRREFCTIVERVDPSELAA